MLRVFTFWFKRHLTDRFAMIKYFPNCHRHHFGLNILLRRFLFFFFIKSQNNRLISLSFRTGSAYLWIE